LILKKIFLEGFLVSIHDDEEMDFVGALIKDNDAWIGLETNGLTSKNVTKL
jgi:hypothetical protein